MFSLRLFDPSSGGYWHQGAKREYGLVSTPFVYEFSTIGQR
jgi:hypothetical protein